MNSNQQLASRLQTQRVKRVLNAGSGPQSARGLHPVFCTPQWQQVRLDIDPEAKPDVAASLIDMKAAFPAQSFDAVWSSHSLEHLYKHEVPLALAEFRRVLKPDGFTLITCPDLEAIAALVVEHGLDHVAYTSPMGPITTLDIIFGHSASIARGNIFMAHNTGFTCARLGQLLLDAGFATALAKREGFDLWAVGLMDQADKYTIQDMLHRSGLDMYDDLE
jgi:SAM-dependent methyltransferase